MNTPGQDRAGPEVIQLDINGQLCPSCLLLTLRTVNENADALRNRIMEVVVQTDDRQATGTIPEAVIRMGYQAEVTPNDSGYRIRIFNP